MSALLTNRRQLIRLLEVAREMRRRSEHRYYTYQPDDDLQRDQLGAFMSRKPVVLVKGGNSSGKSRWAAQKIAMLLKGEDPWEPNCPKAPRIWVISAQWQTIQEGVYDHLMFEEGGVLPKWDIESTGTAVPNTRVRRPIITKRGGMVDFMSAEGGEAARRKVQAARLHYVFIDEEVGQEVWDELCARLLKHGGRVFITATLWTSPAWILDLEHRALAGDQDVDCFTFDTERAAKIGHISMDQYKRMERQWSKDTRAIRLHGESRRAHGLVYSGFGRHNICEPFDLPKDATRYCAIDPGWRTFAVLWIAVLPDRSYVLYRELYMPFISVPQGVAAIWEAEGREWDEATGRWMATDRSELIYRRLIDPAEFGVNPGGEVKVGTKILSGGFGMIVIGANNDLKNGIEYVRQHLEPDPGRGTPRCYVFNTLTNYLREIRSYRFHRDAGNIYSSERSDKPISRNDHLLDCHRYIVNSWPSRPGTMCEPEWQHPDVQRRSRFSAWRYEAREAPIVSDNPIERCRSKELQRLSSGRTGRRRLVQAVGGIGSEF